MNKHSFQFMLEWNEKKKEKSKLTTGEIQVEKYISNTSGCLGYCVKKNINF